MYVLKTGVDIQLIHRFYNFKAIFGDDLSGETILQMHILSKDNYYHMIMLHGTIKDYIVFQFILKFSVYLQPNKNNLKTT